MRGREEVGVPRSSAAILYVVYLSAHVHGSLKRERPCYAKDV